MEERHRYSLRKTRVFLLDHLDIRQSRLLDFLYQEEVLTDHDCQRIRTTDQSVDLFLRILRMKGQRAFGIFLQALTDSDLNFVRNALEAKVLEWTDERERKRVREWLRDSYMQESGSRVLFDHMVDHAMAHEIPVGEEGKRLLDVIKRIFPKCQILEENETMWIKDITKATDGTVLPQVKDVMNDKTRTNMGTDRPVAQWDFIDVRNWILSLSLVQEGKQKAADVFREQYIDGDMLTDISMDQAEKPWFKDVPYGIFKKILKERNVLLSLEQARPVSKTRPVGSPESSQVLERFRKFGVQGSMNHSYRRDGQFPPCQNDPDANMLFPLHFFEDTSDVPEPDLVEHILQRIVVLACACLNDRVNATIHFGVLEGREIAGMAVVPTTMTTKIRQGILQYFFSDQTDIVKYCVRRPEFIEVIEECDSWNGSQMYVMEIDIVPDYSVCRNASFTAMPPKKNLKGSWSKGEANIYRLKGGKPDVLHVTEVEPFLRLKDQLAEVRRSAERRLDANEEDFRELKDRMVQLLCHGDIRVTPDIYPILILSPPGQRRDTAYIKNNLAFLKDIDWKAIFDFDPEATLCTYMQESEQSSMRVVNLEEFCENSGKSEFNIKEEIEKSAQQPWVLSNGYHAQGVSAEEPLEWLRKRGKAFREALNFFQQQIPERRAIVVFALLSADIHVMQEAACEMCNRFPDQFVILAEDNSIADPWKAEITRRNCASRETVEQRSVVGIPWRHIHNVCREIKGSHEVEDRIIPTSTGIWCILPEDVRQRLADFEILHYNECDCEVGIVRNKATLSEKEKHMEGQFYHGCRVSWWNFWFQNQVLARHIHETLKGKVQDKMKWKRNDREDARIAKVTLYHQPGSGGSTAARHVLWDSRKVYRCAVVKKITSTTADQVCTLLTYDEEHTPKPLLLLLDNLDERQTQRLTVQIEQRVKSLDHLSPLYGMENVCVLLICRRTTLPPERPQGAHVVLKQELLPAERNWFQTTSKKLEETHDDPKHLICFNILKENFNMEHIKATVASLVQEMKSLEEHNLLRFIAFINTYDIKYRPLPVAAFDSLMASCVTLEHRQRTGGGYGRQVSIPYHWELRLSDPAQILLNQSYGIGLGSVKVLGIIHPLLSKELLVYLTTSEGKTESISDVALEILNTVQVFGQRSNARDQVMKIISDIFCQRDRSMTGKPASKFSPLIERILETETNERAEEVFERACELTRGTFVCQHAARLHIHLRNWTKGQEFAKKAVAESPDTSCLYDTLAWAYFGHLSEYYTNLTLADEPLSPESALEILELGESAINTFRREQSVSRGDPNAQTVSCTGYLGEVKAFLRLLDCLVYVEPFYLNGDEHAAKEKLRRFLVTKDHIPKALEGWKNVNGTNFIVVLREMWTKVRTTMRLIADELVHLRDVPQDDQSHWQRHHVDMKMTDLKNCLEDYFGEVEENCPDDTGIGGVSDFRRRRVYTLVGDSVRDAAKLTEEDGGDKKLLDAERLLFETIVNKSGTADDYRMLLVVALAIQSCDSRYRFDRAYAYTDMAKWASVLYDRRGEFRFDTLEPFMYFTMLNWPRKYKSNSSLVKSIETALKQWSQTYKRMYPKQMKDGEDFVFRKKDAVAFFLTNGSDMASLTSGSEMNSGNTVARQEPTSFWKQQSTISRLQRFHGNLSRQGDRVTLIIEHENGKYPLSIPTSLPWTDPLMLNKRVFFVIGFSWAGPKAYDVSLKDPREDMNQVALGPPVQDNMHRPTLRSIETRARNPEWRCREALRLAKKELQKLTKRKQRASASEEELNRMKQLQVEISSLLKQSELDSFDWE